MKSRQVEMFKLATLLMRWFRIKTSKTRAARAFEDEFSRMGRLGQRLLVGVA